MRKIVGGFFYALQKGPLPYINYLMDLLMAIFSPFVETTSQSQSATHMTHHWRSWINRTAMQKSISIFPILSLNLPLSIDIFEFFDLIFLDFPKTRRRAPALISHPHHPVHLSECVCVSAILLGFSVFPPLGTSSSSSTEHNQSNRDPFCQRRRER